MWATAWAAPWRRAPFLLLRRPGVLATVAGASAVVVAALASVPLFLSSAGTASIDLQVGERCPRDTGVALVDPRAADVREAPPDPFVAVADRLGSTNRWTRLQLVPLASPEGAGGPVEQVTVLAREGALEHVDVVEDGGGAGIWVSDRAAEETGIGVGDRAQLGGVDVPVAGVYRDLAGNNVDRFWCSNADLLLIRAQGADLVKPPPVVLADRATVAAIMASQRIPFAPSVAEAPLRPGLTIDEAEALIAELACHGDGRAALPWCDDGQPLLARRQGGLSREGVPARSDAQFVERYMRSALPFVLDRSRAIQTAVEGGVWPVATFATLAGLGLVAAAASLWFDRRRREVALLSVRGVSPLGLGAKAALEVSMPLLVGGAAGIGLAYAAVRWLGPAPRIEPAALREAAALAAVGLVGAALVVVAVVAVRLRGDGHQVPRWRAAHVVPWELGLVGLAVVSYRRLGEWGVPIGRGADVTHVDLWGLLFPVLFLVATVAVTSRVLQLGLRPARAASTRWPAGPHLAVRRLARARTAALGLVAATAVATGVLAYSSTMDRSLQASLAAKAHTYVGSDVAVALDDDAAAPPGFEGRSTEVRVVGDTWLDPEGERVGVTLLAIDPTTFADATHWDETFADDPLDRILRRLRAAGDGPTPAVAIGVELHGSTPVETGSGRAVELTVAPVSDPEAFPGMKRAKPTLVVDAAALGGHDVVGDRRELWIRGERADVLASLQREGVTFHETRALGDVADRSSFVTVSWTFGFMRSLGLAAGALALGGVAVHLDARRRERVLAYAFLRRMGLSEHQHRRALLVELAATVLVGCVLGLAAAVAGAWLAHGRIDPVPHMAPAPLLRPAVGVLLACLVAAVIVVVVGAWIAQRRAGRDDPVEVLRAGA